MQDEYLRIIAEQLELHKRYLSIIEKTISTIDRISSSSSFSPSSLPSSSSSTSSVGVLLSENNSPWPTSIHGDPCYICKYYGHGFKNCPNIIEDYKDSCLRCYGHGHSASECQLKEQRTLPFKEGFKKPTFFH